MIEEAGTTLAHFVQKKSHMADKTSFLRDTWGRICDWSFRVLRAAPINFMVERQVWQNVPPVIRSSCAVLFSWL